MYIAFAIMSSQKKNQERKCLILKEDKTDKTNLILITVDDMF